MTTTREEPAGRRRVDRPLPPRVRALRLWFALESRLAPRSAELRATRLFMTPPRLAAHRSGDRIGDGGRWTQLVVGDGPSRVAALAGGAGPAALLLHGWGGSSADMMPIGGALARAGFRVVAFDMPGHGRSPGRQSSMVEFLRATRLVADALGAPDVLVGHSLGGAASAFAVTELGIAPRAAVLIAPAPGPARFIEQFARRIGLPADRVGGMLDRIVELVGRSVDSLDAVVAARGARVPALVLHDPADRAVPWTHAEEMARAWPGSRLVPRPGAGHTRILADPETIGAVVEFALEHAGAARRERSA